MNVPSLEFLAFVAVVAVVLRLSAMQEWRRYCLLAANLAFFATFARGAASLLPFVAFLALGYVAMRVAALRREKLVHGLLIVLMVATFCWLKRYAFVPASALLPDFYTTVGLSYVFFRVIGAIVDAAQQALAEPVGPVDYLNFTINFTSFVAGPIQLYKQYRDGGGERPLAVDAAAAGRSIERIVLGFFKVTILSPMLWELQQRALGTAVAPTGNAAILDCAMLLAVFPIYLYVNFSGYTDVAIGAARFLGIELPENFDKPLASRGYLEFWRRWHMSLSHWFKTYVFSPLVLALMRRFPERSVEPYLGVVAYFVTFFLVGLWHGQTLMFVAMGLLMGLGVSGNKLYEIVAAKTLGRERHARLRAMPAYSLLCVGMTFFWLALTVLPFWATWPQLAGLAGTFGPVVIVEASASVILGFGLLQWTWSALQHIAPANLADRLRAGAAFLRPAWYAALATIVVTVAVVLNAPAPHVVYKAF